MSEWVLLNYVFCVRLEREKIVEYPEREYRST